MGSDRPSSHSYRRAPLRRKVELLHTDQKQSGCHSQRPVIPDGPKGRSGRSRARPSGKGGPTGAGPYALIDELGDLFQGVLSSGIPFILT
jgi:hypothetical protein